MKKILLTALFAMSPVLELRGSIPLGIGMGLPPVTVFLISILCNMVPVPFIIVFIRRIFEWLGKKSPFFGRIVGWIERKAGKKADLVYKYELFGLLLSVAVPLPGTGAWTGALLAALMDIRLKAAVPVIFGGVVIAGIIMTLLSCGVISLF